MVNVILMIALALVAAVGIAVDDRTMLGESVWVKPLKFAIAFTLYSGLLAWLVTKLRKARRFGWWAGTVFAVAATAEVAGITVQAARGTFSHFNSNLDDTVTVAMTQLFTYGVAGILIAQLAVAGTALAQGAFGKPVTRAVRHGLVLATVGMLVPVWWMTTNISERTVVDANGAAVTMYQGHGIGDLDGHGMFLTNWSDFRVPHFVGLHGIHVLLITAAALAVLGRKVPALRDESVRARLVTISGLAYAGLLGVLTWQAGRGQSLIHPDAATALALGVVSAGAAAAVGAVLVPTLRRAATA